ncbi:MAG TPA: MFS transporter [Polyangiaceae bacterium]|nr:MFS transporter [Polyangiaceae bacterium]
MDAPDRLRLRTKLGFGIGAMPEAAAQIAFNTWSFVFYNSVLGLSGTLCGLAATCAIVLEAVADPAIGAFSDRFRSGLGRRHPFMFAAPLPFVIALYCLYSPPAALHGFSLFAWLTVFAVLHRQAMSLFYIPYLALGAELSNDYQERSIVMSYATLFGVIGGAGVFVYGWTHLGHVPGGSAVRSGYPGLAMGIGLFVALAMLGSARATRDQIPRLVRAMPAHASRFGLRELGHELRGALSNRNYRMLLIGMVFFSVVVGVRETLDSYLSLFFWRLPADKIRAFGLATPPASILAFFVTPRLHSRFGKRNTLVTAVATMIAAAALPIAARLGVFFPSNGSAALLPTLMLFVFVAYGALAVILITVLSAVADITDEHELVTGRRQEGLFYSARILFGKLTTAFGHVIAGLSLDLIGFHAGAKPGQVSADVLVKLGLVIILATVIPGIIAMLFYGRYSITRQRHLEIRRELAARRAPPVDELPAKPVDTSTPLQHA